MARQTNVHFIGRMGNVVGSTWKGIPYFRSMPDRVKQSAATVAGNKIMGKASMLGAALRRQLAPLFPDGISKPIRDRFTGTIKKWLQTKPLEQPLPATQLPWVLGFDFNDTTALAYRFRVDLQLQPNGQGGLLLTIPTFVPRQQVTAPAYTKALQVQLLVANYHIAAWQPIETPYHISLSIPYTTEPVPGQQITLPYTLPAGSLSLLAVAIQYNTLKKGMSGIDLRPEWQPCGIAAAYVL